MYYCHGPDRLWDGGQRYCASVSAFGRTRPTCLAIPGAEDTRCRTVKTFLSGFKTLSFSRNSLKSFACLLRTVATPSTELQSWRRSARVCLAKSMPVCCLYSTKAASKSSRKREDPDGALITEEGKKGELDC